MSKHRPSRREWQRKKNRGRIGTYKHHPTIRIPDPSYTSIFKREKDSFGSGFPNQWRLELVYGTSIPYDTEIDK